MPIREQVWWGSTAVDNGTTRLIDGPVTINRGGDGLKLVMVPLLIQADTTELLQAAYRTAIGELLGVNKRCRVALIDDDDATAGGGDYLEDFTAGDGFAIATQANLSTDPTRAQTEHSLPLVYTIAAKLSAFNEDPAQEGPTEIVGQSGQFSFTTTYSAGRIQNRTVEATFVATTGLTGKANYEAARESILTTYLGCAASGARGADGLALILELREEVDGTEDNYRVLLQSAYVPNVGIAAARNAAITFTVSEMDEWQDKFAGSRPKVVTARGSVVFEATPGTNLIAAHWTRLLAHLSSQATTLGGGGAAVPIQIARSPDSGSNTIAFEVSFRVGNAETLLLDLKTIEAGERREVWYHGQQKEYVQASGLGPARTYSVTIERVGVSAWEAARFDELAVQVLPGASNGSVWWPGLPTVITKPNVTTPWGTDVAVQSYSKVWTLRKTDAKPDGGSASSGGTDASKGSP